MLVGLGKEESEAHWNATVHKFSYHQPRVPFCLELFAALLQLHWCKQGHAERIAACFISGFISGTNECSHLQRELGLWNITIYICLTDQREIRACTGQGFLHIHAQGKQTNDRTSCANHKWKDGERHHELQLSTNCTKNCICWKLKMQMLNFVNLLLNCRYNQRKFLK